MLKKFIKKHWVLTCCVIAILYAGLIHILFTWKSDDKWLIAKWSAGDILTYASTISLAL